VVPWQHKVQEGSAERQVSVAVFSSILSRLGLQRYKEVGKVQKKNEDIFGYSKK
jgi:hypothetical protein